MNYNASNDIAKLKHALRTLIQAEAEKFTAATGLTPKSIRADFIETTKMGSNHRTYALDDVQVDFSF